MKREANGLKENLIEIKEEVRIPGTDIILERGDKVKIMKEAYYRMPDSIIGNELYSFKNEIVSFYENLKNGNDVNMERLSSLKKTFDIIYKSVKSFN